MNTTVFFMVGFVTYVVIMVCIGHLTTRGKAEGENFLSGGKSVSLFLMVGTLVATCVGTGSSMGATANGYLHGWAGSLVGLGNGLGMLGMLLFLKMRRYDLLTMSEEAQFYFNGNRTIRRFMSVILFVVEIIWVGSHINGGSKYLCYVTGLNPLIAKTIITVGFVGYAYFGGYLAVVWTDAIQMVIILSGFTLILLKALPAAGGWETIKAAYDAAGNTGVMSFYGIESYGIMPALTLFVASFFNVIAVPSFHTRLFSASSDQVAKKSQLFSVVIVILFSFLPAILGMCAFSIASTSGTVLESADFAFSYLAITVLGPWVGLLFLISGLSATLSSADSDLISGVTILIEDVYPVFSGKRIEEKYYKKISRFGMLFSVVLSYGLALYATDIIGYITNVAGSLLPGIGITMILGRFWKRVTWQGGMAATISGILFGMIYLLVPQFHGFIMGIFAGPAIPVTILSFLVGVIVSLATPASDKTEEELLALIKVGRN